MSNQYQKGTPLLVNWYLKRPDGDAFSLSGYQATISGRNSRGSITISTPTINYTGGYVSFVLTAEMQNVTGLYSFEMKLYQNNTLKNSLLANDIIEIVREVTSNESQQTEADDTTVNIFSVGQVNLFEPSAPVPGSDGYWYFNGQPLLDDNDNPIPINYTLRFVTEGANYGRIIINEGRSTEQTIDGLKTLMATLTSTGNTAESKGNAAETKGNTAATKASLANDAAAAASSAASSASSAATAATTAAASAAAVTEHAEEVISQAELAAKTAFRAADRAEQKAARAMLATRKNNDSGTYAKQKGDLANAAADRANELSDHPMYINTSNYHWMKWDESNGTYVDTGIMASCSPYATFDVNLDTGSLEMETDSYYAGPDFSIEDGDLVITI